MTNENTFIAAGYCLMTNEPLGEGIAPLSGDIEEIEAALLDEFGADSYWKILGGGLIPRFLADLNITNEKNMQRLADYAEALEEAWDVHGIPGDIFTAVCSDQHETVDPGAITLAGNASDPAQFAMQLVDEFGSVLEMLTPEQIEGYLDWDKLGRDLLHDYYEVDGYAVMVDA